MTTTGRKIVRPDCAGWHEADPMCDGDGGEPACEYREKCLAVCAIVGGKAKRTVDLIEATLEEWDDFRIGQWLEEQDASQGARGPSPVSASTSGPAKASRAPTAPANGAGGDEPLPGFGLPVKVFRSARDIHARPSPRYDHVLPVLDTIVERIARELGRRVLPENDPDLCVGDLFVRYTPGMSGRLVGFYEATNRGTKSHRILARFVLTRRHPTLNFKTNCQRLADAKELKPPSGIVCRVWADTKPTVALVGVDGNGARESAAWFVRLYNNKLIEGRT